MNLISVCIPCYDMYGKGVAYLEQLLHSIKRQNYSNYEVIVSDDSTSDKLKNVCLSFNKIKYVKNLLYKTSSSINMNNAILNASGDIIKPMFQDDYLSDESTLSYINNRFSLNGDLVWGATGFSHTDENNTEFQQYMTPVWNNDIIKGVNTIGGPSNIFFKRNCGELFDEDLVWLMDCEFYYRLNKYSPMNVINKMCSVTRIWGDSVTHHVSEEIKKLELNYVLKKHNLL